MAVYAKPQQWKKEGSERLRGERDEVKFIDLKCKDGHCRIQESKKKARRGKKRRG